MAENSVLQRLTQIEPDWADVQLRATLRHRSTRRPMATILVGLLAALVLAGAAYAARTLWTGHNMTPAEIEAQATTVYNDRWAVCNGKGQCTNQTGTHRQVLILPSMGVTFVLPPNEPDRQKWVSIVPASPFLQIPADWGGPAPKALQPANPRGSYKPLEDSSGHTIGGDWTVQLPSGGTREITWFSATGAITVRDTIPDGATTATPLHAGDVVPLVPGSLDNDSRSLDKAVTFDLPTGNQVIIFPRLNKTYIDLPEPQPGGEPLAPGEAAKYGLQPIGEYNGRLPVSSRGGDWTVHLPDGTTRTISWAAGNSYVTITDFSPGAAPEETQVPIGHDLPLVPFK